MRDVLPGHCWSSSRRIFQRNSKFESTADGEIDPHKISIFGRTRLTTLLPSFFLISAKQYFTSCFLLSDVTENGLPLGMGSSNQSSPVLPIALPLRRRNSKPVKRHDDYWQDDKGKGSKISKIFQLAITALSFFAFGGYLLTLIITALKKNATSTTTGNVIFLQVIILRPWLIDADFFSSVYFHYVCNYTLLQGLQNVRRPKRGVLNDPMENDFNTERLYRGMIMLSEGYALYNWNWHNAYADLACLVY